MDSSDIPGRRTLRRVVVNRAAARRQGAMSDLHLRAKEASLCQRDLFGTRNETASTALSRISRFKSLRDRSSDQRSPEIIKDLIHKAEISN
jgi:predicted alpha/beta-hydrolase family hydrolase